MAVVVALVACTAASAQTLYKLIDKNGKVTYSETAPKFFDGQVIRIDIDPNANTATLPKPAPGKTGAEKAVDAAAQERQRVARVKTDIARRALQEARDNPGPDDFQLIGNAGGGTRQVPSQAYQDRLSRLEKAMQDAEEDLKRVEK
jgi:ribosomal protein L21E